MTETKLMLYFKALLITSVILLILFIALLYQTTLNNNGRYQQSGNFILDTRTGKLIQPRFPEKYAPDSSVERNTK